MTPSLDTSGIRSLTVAERLELIELIWDSLPDAVSPAELPTWHIAELAQRRPSGREARPRSTLAGGARPA